MAGQLDGLTAGQLDGSTAGWLDGLMAGWLDSLTAGWLDGSTARQLQWLDNLTTPTAQGLQQLDDFDGSTTPMA